MKLPLVLFFVLVSLTAVEAQKQLILLKRESVVARFTEGEYLRCKLKNKTKKEGKIIELTDTHLITSNDTLTISSIESLNMKGRRKISVTSGIGGLLFVSGIGYFAIDQANRLIVKGAGDFDEQVAITSLALTATGAAILFIKSPYKKVYGHALKTIDYTSRFYLLK
ncbi:MAG: hypothetical protein RI909_352 [Bacteroidota bacterium]|jgi:hypothetical protein